MVKAAPPPYDEAAEKSINAMEDTSTPKRVYTYATVQPGVLHAAVEISSRELEAGQWTKGAEVHTRVLRGTGGVLTTATGRGCPSATRSEQCA